MWHVPHATTQDINSCKVVAVKGGNGCASLSEIKSSIDLMERVEEIVNVEGSDELNGADDGVDDVTLGAVGAVGLPAALIALWTDVLVCRFDGIVNQNKYLKYTKQTQQNTKSKVPI